MACAEQVAHPQDDLLTIEGLGQKVIRTQDQRTVSRHCCRVSREHHHRQVTEAVSRTAQTTEYLEPVDVWHVQVEQHDIGLKLTECLLDLTSVSYRSHLICDALEECLEEFNVCRFVVHDQNAIAQWFLIGRHSNP